MKNNADFLYGMCAGLVVGTAVEMMIPSGRSSMKTQAGKNIQKLGIAVDHTVSHLISNLR